MKWPLWRWRSAFAIVLMSFPRLALHAPEAFSFGSRGKAIDTRLGVT